jgi:hypothetical protein
VARWDALVCRDPGAGAARLPLIVGLDVGKSPKHAGGS